MYVVKTVFVCSKDIFPQSRVPRPYLIKPSNLNTTHTGAGRLIDEYHAAQGLLGTYVYDDVTYVYDDVTYVQVLDASFMSIMQLKAYLAHMCMMM